MEVLKRFGAKRKPKEKKIHKNEARRRADRTSMVVLESPDSNFIQFPLPNLVESISPGRKIEWLRSQIVGRHAECVTPFGERKLLYADHTASGRSLMCIEQYVLHHLLPVYGNTHTVDNFVGQTMGRAVDGAAAYIKKCLRGTEDDALFFCGFGSTAAMKKLQEMMGITVASPLKQQVLAGLEKNSRWVVFVGPYEHHSNLLSWRESLAEVVEITHDKAGEIDLEQLTVALRDPKYEGRPKLGSFSACSNVTGLVTKTRSIARILHAHSAYACFDFAASAPHVEIDVRSGQADGYDAVFISPHKFMGGPGTSAILLMNKKLYRLGSMAPSTSGGGTVDFVGLRQQDTVYHENIESREMAGTPGIVEAVRTGLVFWVKEFMGTDLMSTQETAFMKIALSRLGCNPKVQLYGSTAAERVSIISFNVYPGVDVSEGDCYDLDSVNSNGMDTAKSVTLSHDCKAAKPGGASPLRQFFSATPGGASPLRQFFSSIKPMKAAKGNSPTESAHSAAQVQPSIRNYGDGTSLHTMRESLKRNSGPEQPARNRGKPLHGRFVVTLLNDLFGIQGRGGCSCAGPYGHYLLSISDDVALRLRGIIIEGFESLKPGWARVSLPYYGTIEELDFLITAVEFIADFGHKFLKLYDLDWKTGNWSFREELRFMITDAEKLLMPKNRQTLSLFVGDIAGAPTSCFTFKPTSTSPWSSSNANSGAKLNSTYAAYFQVAKYFAHANLDAFGALPARELPPSLDPSLVNFLF